MQSLRPTLLWGSVNWSDRLSTHKAVLHVHRSMLNQIVAVPKRPRESFGAWLLRRVAVWNSVLQKSSSIWWAVQWQMRKHAWQGHVGLLTRPNQVLIEPPPATPRLVSAIIPHLEASTFSQRALVSAGPERRPRAGRTLVKWDRWQTLYNVHVHHGNPDWLGLTGDRIAWRVRLSEYINYVYKYQVKRQGQYLLKNFSAVFRKPKSSQVEHCSHAHSTSSPIWLEPS